MSIYSVIVIEHPTKKDRDENDADERIVLGPVCVVAKSSSRAGSKVVIANAELFKDFESDPDRLEVIVVPFQ